MKSRIKKICKSKFPKAYNLLKHLYHYYYLKDENITRSIDLIIKERYLELKNHVQGEHRILLIGRIKDGDSIANHTYAFLNTIEYKTNDVFLYDEYTHDLLYCRGRNKREFIIKCYACDLNNEFFDLMIYLNILDQLDNQTLFINNVPKKRPFLTLAYVVFDGTIPPVEWVNILNDYFDASLVPSKNIIENLKRGGVNIPVFELPVAVNLNKYIQKSSNHNHDKIFTFGWIGSFEDRKNPLKIIESFSDAFGNNKNIKLVMHTRFVDKRTEAGIKLNEISNKYDNIDISVGVIDENSLIKMFETFDAYVYVSMGEGYSVTPRHALALGKALILSAIPTHRNITNLDENEGVFWVPAEKEVPAVQPSLNNRVCGVMYDIEKDDLVRIFKEVYSKRYFINKEEVKKIRMRDVMKYDFSNLEKLYMTIISPNSVVFSNKNTLTEGKIETSDTNLYYKYNKYILTKNVNIYTLPANDGGFCSNFNKFMAHLVYLPQNTILIPDWRVKKLKSTVFKYFSRTNFESFCYGVEKDDNIFFKLFENPYRSIINDDIINTDIIYNISTKNIEANDYNAEHEPNLTYINSYNLYNNKAYFNDFRLRYNKVYSKYIKLRKNIKHSIDDFFNNNVDTDFLITALVKSSAGQSELLADDKPTHELYVRHINSILDENDINLYGNWKLFIATDNVPTIDFFENEYPGHVIFQNISRLTKKDLDIYKIISDRQGKNIEGYGIQHKMAADEYNWSLNNSYEILFDVNMLARGSYFIYVNSNISTMVSYLNPQIKMIYCR